MKNLILIAAVCCASLGATCKEDISAAAKTVAADLQVIASQAKAQGFDTAVQKLAADLEEIVPTLSKPGQEAVQNFLNILQAAVDPAGPGGKTITNVERFAINSSLTALLLATGMTTQQINLVLDDLAQVFASVQGISTAQLQSDLAILKSTALACIAR